MVATVAKLAEHAKIQQPTEGYSLLSAVLAIREKTLGPDHPDVAATLDILADLHTYHSVTDKQNFQRAEAIPLYERALGIRQKTLGPDHVDLTATLNSPRGPL